MTAAFMIQDEVIDHYKYPRHRGTLVHPTFSVELINQSCGDRIVVAARLDAGKIRECGFQGEGCVLSQAAASMLMEDLWGSDVAKVATIDAQYMQNRLGITVGPTRLRCVLLALEALRKGLAQDR